MAFATNKMIIMDNFIKFLEQYLKCKNDLAFLYKILALFFEHIKNTNTLEEAELSFKVLEDIQFILAKVVYKKEVTLPANLSKFISDFDRVDDEDMRAYLYSKIKSNDYFI